MKSLAFVMDSQRCTGCKACMIACMDKHNLQHGVLWRRVLEYSGGEWTVSGNTVEQNVFAYYVSLSCNHCAHPLCAESCPTQAIEQDNQGIVSIDAARCIGCRACERACPYGAPQFDRVQRKMTKCDFCRDSLEQGEAPACVAACPCRALDYGEYAVLLQRYGQLDAVAPLPDPALTQPRLIVLPHKQARPQGSTEGLCGDGISNPCEVGLLRSCEGAL